MAARLNNARMLSQLIGGAMWLGWRISGCKAWLAINGWRGNRTALGSVSINGLASNTLSAGVAAGCGGSLYQCNGAKWRGSAAVAYNGQPSDAS